MKAASVHEIKQSLKNMDIEQLSELCLKLARFKKENKELLTFMLYEADDIDNYIESVKEKMDLDFAAMNTTSIYLIKKTLRKILRNVNKYIRYTGNKAVEIEVLLHYCTSFKGLKVPVHKSAALINIYNTQIKKIGDAIAGLHEDLQYDYLKTWKRLQ